MNIHTPASLERRTSAADVFERLHADIVSLRLAPGSKLSEVDVARQSNVSRQPVREAFIRLSNLDLLEIRPQRATLVRKISVRNIRNARFIRTAVEVEVMRKACALVDKSSHGRFARNLKLQRQAAERMETNRFHELDYEFHRLMCIAADCEFAFATIADNKAQVDRLCMLSLADREGMETLCQDHEQMFQALQARDEEALVNVARLHLSRLDETLAAARESHSDYFED